MPSNSFYLATRKLVGNPNRISPPLSPTNATYTSVSAMCYEASVKSTSTLTKAILKPFADPKAKFKNAKSQNKTKNDNKIKSTEIAAAPVTPAQQCAIITHPTASKASQCAVFKLNTIVIIDNVTHAIPREVLRDVTVPAQSPILDSPAPVCEAALLVLVKFAVHSLIIKQDKIDQLQGTSCQRSQALESLCLQLESAAEQVESYRLANRKLSLENSKLKSLRTSSGQTISEAKYSNLLLKDELRKKNKLLQKAIPQYSAAQICASQADNTAAALQKIVAFWQHNANAFQSQNAQLQATVNHWRGRTNAAEEARDKERLAHAKTQADVNELRAIHEGLTFRSCVLLEQRATKNSEYHVELNIKDARIAALEAKLADLLAEKSTRTGSVSSTSFANSSADGDEGSSISSSPTSNGDIKDSREDALVSFEHFVKENARLVRGVAQESSQPPLPPSSYDGASSGTLDEDQDEWEGEEDEATDETNQQVTNGAPMVNSRHSSPLRGTTTPSSSPPKLGKYTVEPPSTSLGNTPAMAPTTTPLPGFSFSFGDNDRNPFSSSSPSYTPPSLSPHSSPMFKQLPSSFGLATTETRNAQAIKNSKRPGSQLSAFPASNQSQPAPVSVANGYSTKESDLSSNAVDLFAPIGASRPRLSTPAAEVPVADVEMVDYVSADDIPVPESKVRIESTKPPEIGEQKPRRRKCIKPFSGPHKGGKGKALKFGKKALGDVEPYVPKKDVPEHKDEVMQMETEDVQRDAKEEIAGGFEKTSGGAFTFSFGVAPDTNPFSCN